MDTHYTAGWFTRLAGRLGICWVGTLPPKTTVVERKRSPWSVETSFRDTKQYAGLGAFQCWTDQAMVRHVALVLVTFVVLQRLRIDPAESVGAVKERWQLAITRQGQPPPHP